LDGLAIAALEAATTNVIYPNGQTAVGNLTENDILDKTFANRLYNKLARTNVPGIGGSYFGIAHDDCLHDLREDAGVGGWIDVSKYADPQSALRNEIGMANGIRWLRSSNVTVTDGGGAGSVDSYEVQVVGFNALGRADASALELKITGPFDKLGRYLNYGWYWLGKYGTIDEANMVSGICASSVGANS
jgi:N4-gp56 family major capsid protein